MAISVAPLTTTVMNSVDEDQSGIASGINNAVSRTAALLAVAVFGAIMLHSFDTRLEHRLASIEIPQPTKQEVLNQRIQLAAIKIPTELETKNQNQVKQAIQTSFISAFRWVMIISAGLAIASAFVTWRMIEGKPKRAD
jgi:hypothetical protein